MKSFIQLTRMYGFSVSDTSRITIQISAISIIEPRCPAGTTLVLHPDSPAIDVIEPYRTVLSMLNGPRGVCPDCGDVFNSSTGICPRCDNQVDEAYEKMRADLVEGAV